MAHFNGVVPNSNESFRNAPSLHYFRIYKDPETPGISFLVSLYFESVFRLLLFAMLSPSLKTIPIKPVRSKNRVSSLLV